MRLVGLALASLLAGAATTRRRSTVKKADGVRFEAKTAPGP
jgi:hypothetical protein